ncbi:hypothetical protein FM107_06765 [Sphingobacterium sp. JB170]|nr:hypothetical protein FM107_06765 [Sphingobacterium sp. JB170]
MMPNVPVAYGNSAKSGEIDIMEHVNTKPVIHQTIHNGAVRSMPIIPMVLYRKRVKSTFTGMEF